MSEIVLRMEEIEKSFPGVKANDKISIDLKRGEVLALLGENGSGKSTLMNILYGFYKADSGRIFINDQELRITSPKVAIDHGIGMIHQHFMLVPVFTALDNIILGYDMKKGVRLNREHYRKSIQEISDKYGLTIDLDKKIADMSVGEQQKVEIVKCLFRNAEILILDEPTAVLTPQESDDLFQIMRRYVSDGKSVIFISHKMDELIGFSDRIVILRAGKKITTYETKDTSVKELASAMVGHDVEFYRNDSDEVTTEKKVEIKNLKVRDHRGVEVLKGVSLDIREGEILGLAGIDGNGQSELSEALMGLREIAEGSVSFEGKDITNQNVNLLREAGIGYVPPDRKRQGLVTDLSIRENLIIDEMDRPEYSKGPFLKLSAIRKETDEQVKEYDVRPANADLTAGSLSGGNQQKVIIARVFRKAPKFLVAVNPIRGIDINAAEFVHKKLLDLKASGSSILLISTDLEEIFDISDRIAVICDGRIIGVEQKKKLTVPEVGLMMTGMRKEEAHEG